MWLLLFAVLAALGAVVVTVALTAARRTESETTDAVDPLTAKIIAQRKAGELRPPAKPAQTPTSEVVH